MWTESLDGFAVFRLGAAMTEELPLMMINLIRGGGGEGAWTTG